MTYSSTVSMNRKRFAGRNQNTTNFSSTSNVLGPVSNTISLIILACLLGLLYLTQVTKTNAFSYKINTLQKQQTELKSQNSDLEVASARLQSLDRVKNSEVAKNLVSVAPVSTIQN